MARAPAALHPAHAEERVQKQQPLFLAAPTRPTNAFVKPLVCGSRKSWSRSNKQKIRGPREAFHEWANRYFRNAYAPSARQTRRKKSQKRTAVIAIQRCFRCLCKNETRCRITGCGMHVQPGVSTTANVKQGRSKNGLSLP